MSGLIYHVWTHGWSTTLIVIQRGGLKVLKTFWKTYHGLKKRDNPHSTPKNETLSMTKINIGLMGVCSNYYMHKNYKDKWQKDMSKFKSKTQSKGTKTKTQRLKPRTWSVQNQSIKKYLLRWNKTCKHKKNRTRLWCKIVMINKFKVIGSYFYFYPFGDLTQRSSYGGFRLLIN
jgi:hypothetical protein